ncbi:MAG: hypothetical protein LBF24_04075 [Puniceicoccales bacterium]|nr:hypothetical protein [Puniceicoccales bacterium]
MITRPPWDVLVFGGECYFDAAVEKFTDDRTTRTIILENSQTLRKRLRAKPWAIVIFAVFSLLSGGVLTVVALVLRCSKTSKRAASIEAWGHSPKGVSSDPLLAFIFSMVPAASRGKLPPLGDDVRFDPIVFPGMAVGLPEKFCTGDVYSEKFCDELFAAKVRNVFDRLKIHDETIWDSSRNRETSIKEYAIYKLESLPIALSEEKNIPGTSLVVQCGCHGNDVRLALKSLNDLIGPFKGEDLKSFSFEGTPPTQEEWNQTLAAIDAVREDFRRMIILGARQKFPHEDRDITPQDRQNYVAAVNAYLAK